MPFLLSNNKEINTKNVKTQNHTRAEKVTKDHFFASGDVYVGVRIRDDDKEHFVLKKYFCIYIN